MRCGGGGGGGALEKHGRVAISAPSRRTLGVARNIRLVRARGKAGHSKEPRQERKSGSSRKYARLRPLPAPIGGSAEIGRAAECSRGRARCSLGGSALAFSLSVFLRFRAFSPRSVARPRKSARRPAPHWPAAALRQSRRRLITAASRARSASSRRVVRAVRAPLAARRWTRALRCGLRPWRCPVSGLYWLCPTQPRVLLGSVAPSLTSSPSTVSTIGLHVRRHRARPRSPRSPPLQRPAARTKEQRAAPAERPQPLER